MKTRIILAFLLTIGIFVHGQINTFLKTFSATPGYNTTEYFFTGLDTLSKNSFVTAGCKMRSPLNSNDTLVIDGYIQKTEISGLTKWFRSYHINGYTLALKDLKVISNKEILAVGQTDEYGTPDGNLKHGIIMKTDSNGYVVWCRLYPKQKIYNVLRRSDGNIAILASDSGGWFANHLKLALLNSSGNLIWCKRLLSPDSNFYGIHLKEGINKSLLINNKYLAMILLDSNGNHVNDVAFNPPTAGDGIHNVINYYNQYYYITGLNTCCSPNKLVSTITKTDASLNIIWHKNYQSAGGNSEFHNIVALAPNNLMVFCEPENYGYTPNLQRSGFAFFDSSGTFKKSHLFTSDSFPILPYELIHLRNGKFLFTAWSQNIFNYFGIVDTASVSFCKQTSINWNTVSASSLVNTNSYSTTNASFNYSLVSVYMYQPIDATIEYVCSNGPTGALDTTAVFIEEEFEHNSINIFPIPTSDFIYLDFNLKVEKRNFIEIKLFNSLGQQIMANQFFLESKYVPLDLRYFPNGVYYLTIKTDPEKTIIKKVILTKN